MPKRVKQPRTPYGRMQALETATYRRWQAAVKAIGEARMAAAACSLTDATHVKATLELAYAAERAYYREWDTACAALDELESHFSRPQEET